MAQHYKVHQLLTREQLDELEAFEREPGRTVDELCAWFADRGHEISRGAVWNWKVEFDLNDKIRRSAELSAMYVQTAQSLSPEKIAAASSLKFQQMLFEYLSEASAPDANDLMKIAQAMKTGLGAHSQLEELKSRQRQAVEAAEAATKSGATAASVVDTMKKALGITQ